jgi:hypothetical protein
MYAALLQSVAVHSNSHKLHVAEHFPARIHDQVEKAGMAVGMRAVPDKGYDMDELEVRIYLMSPDVLTCPCKQ